MWKADVVLHRLHTTKRHGRKMVGGASVSVAMKNKVDLAIAVCLGSSIQIALFAVPLMVILGWTMDVSPRPMTLDFNAMNAITFVLGVLLVIFIVQNGSSNFMHGSLLLGCYCIIGVGYAYSS